MSAPFSVTPQPKRARVHSLQCLVCPYILPQDDTWYLVFVEEHLRQAICKAYQG